MLFFVCGVENVDPAIFVKDNKVTDGADANATETFDRAAQTFALLNAVTTSDASDESVLNGFRTTLNADLGNATSNPQVAQEWDSYLFVDDAKLQGYYSVGYQLQYENQYRSRVESTRPHVVGVGTGGGGVGLPPTAPRRAHAKLSSVKAKGVRGRSKGNAAW